MMDKDLHWLIRSLNNHLNGLDAQNDEVLMWRKRFLKEQNASPIIWNYFLSNPSSTFQHTSPEDLLKQAKEYSEQ